MTDMQYGWHGWAAETENENDDDREDVYYLTITEGGEEMAVIMHRLVGGKYPLDGEVANSKVRDAERIVAALNMRAQLREAVGEEARLELIAYEEWSADRRLLSEMEETGGPPASRWHDSDDGGVELANRLASIVARILEKEQA